MFLTDFADLLRPVTLLKRIVTTNEYGELTESWGSPSVLQVYIEKKQDKSSDDRWLIHDSHEYLLVCEVSTPIALRDRIADAGKELTVTNIETRYDGPTAHHLEVTLTLSK